MATSEEISKCEAETHKHVRQVQRNINIFIRDLMTRSEKHDDSKFVEPELSIFAENTERLSQVEYGSPEYKECLERVSPALSHHYANNSHHPENHKNGVDDMDLMDIIEMLADWKAATERMKDGNIKKSLEINAKRFKMSPQLESILENTIKRYF